MAIRLDGLAKTYIVEEDRATTLKETVLRWFHPVRREYIEALRPLTLEARKGETVGVIGHNGAGKSTLLKLIAGVTAPTEGSIEVNGSLIGLLELGAGFQMELSGVENIFLNGSILGLSDREINELLPSIIEFSGLEEFIFTPVRHYSSGMVMRLGFSIAAHIEPDIILLDENLAVGDQPFQIKCLSKLRDLKRRGKTILMVTHQLDMAEWLCDRIVWLREGEVVESGPPGATLHRYEQSMVVPIETWNEETARQQRHSAQAGRYGTGEAVIRELTLRSHADGEARHLFVEGDSMRIEIEYEAMRDIPNLNVEVGVYREDLMPAFYFNLNTEQGPIHARTGPGTVCVRIPELLLRPGRYYINPCLSPNDAPGEFFDIQFYLYQFRVNPRSHWRMNTVAAHPCDIEVRRSD